LNDTMAAYMRGGSRSRTEIDIEDDGSINVAGTKDGVEQAVSEIELMTREYEIGQKYHGEVVKLVDFGAFIRLDPNTEALLHISEIAPHRIENVEDVLSVGQTIPVIAKTRDDQGRLKLSLKDADPSFTSPNANH